MYRHRLHIQITHGIRKVESVGEGVTTVQPGDHVIPLYTAGKPSTLVKILVSPTFSPH
jgi:hypothetical protein